MSGQTAQVVWQIMAVHLDMTQQTNKQSLEYLKRVILKNKKYTHKMDIKFKISVRELRTNASSKGH